LTVTAEQLRIATVITRLEGGAGVLALRGLLALDPHRYRSTIITGRGGELLVAARRAGIETILEPALRVPIRPPVDLIALQRLTRLFRQRRFDVVHTHCAKAGAVGRLAAHRAGTSRIVHTYHGFPFHQFQSPLRRQLYVRIERALGALTDLALCVGSGVAAEAIRRGLISPDRVRTTGVAVPEDVPVADAHRRARARQRLGLPAHAVVVGAVGRLTYQKAPEDFLAALDRLARPDVLGVWIGDGELGASLRNGGGRVRFVGERDDVAALLPAFDVFVQPSRYEGLPLAVVEAMRCGVPVVATAVNAVPDVVVPGETGLLVAPQRPDQLAAAVSYLIDHPEEATRMAAEAREWVAGRHREQDLAAALVTAYGAEAGTGHGIERRRCG